ncbi:hypothetical protein [Halopiger goleimassiliensis]|uniref:hypothetical protein n=1 Tax=Halopiger goleimassiliensis TaxID=1293048 RepID=UPI0018A81B22|nr:hypothetical protein [Halopiger goleimassiliensis]
MSDSRPVPFSPVGFAIALVAVSVGTAAGLALLPAFGSFLGMLGGGVVAGLAIEDRPLIEAGLAAVLANLGVLAAAAGIGTGIVAAVTALGSIAPTTLLGSIVLSFAVGAFGAHFGDDLRDGLTEPVEESSPRVTTSGSRSSPVAESAATDAVDETERHEPAADETRGSETEGTGSNVERRSERSESTDDRETERSESRDDLELDRN